MVVQVNFTEDTFTEDTFTEDIFVKAALVRVALSLYIHKQPFFRDRN